MSILGKFTNPVWYEIEKLNPQQKLEISYILNIKDYLRVVLSEEKQIVRCLEHFCETGTPVYKKNGNIIAPFSAQIRERLIDEVEIGFLCCSKGKTLGDFKFQYFKPGECIDGIGGLVLADINFRIGRNEPALLDNTNYSNDPDECKVQVLIKWMEILGLDNPDFVKYSSMTFFDEFWNSYQKSFFSGTYTGFKRVPLEVFFKHTSKICPELSPLGKTIIRYLVEKIAKASELPKESLKNSFRTKNHNEKDSPTVDDLYQEVIYRGGELLQKIDSKKRPFYKNPPSVREGDMDMERIYRDIMEPIMAENLLYFFLVLVGVRRSGGDEVYFNGEEYKKLENLVNEAAVKLFIHKMKNSNLVEKLDKVHLMEKSQETLTQLRKIVTDQLKYFKKRGPKPHGDLIAWLDDKISITAEGETEIKVFVQQAVDETLKGKKF